MEQHPDLIRFVQSLVMFRRSNPTLRRRNFLSGISARQGELPDVSWFDPAGHGIDWKNGEQGLVCIFGAPMGSNEQARHVMLMLNPIGQPREFMVPDLVRTVRWRRFIDTAAESPADVFPNLDGPPPPLSGPIKLAERSLVCYVSG